MKNKFLTLALVLVFLAIPLTADAAKQTFNATGEYTMSDYENPSIAEQRAIDYAMRSAAEQAGVYIKTYTRSSGSQIAEDEVKAMVSRNIKLVSKQLDRKILTENDIRITRR